MLYRDVDRSIGYMLSVSMVQSHPLIPVMEKELGEVPLHTDRVGEESYIDLFVQGEKALRFEKLVSAYDHEMRGDLLTVKLKSAEMGIVSGIMDRILDIETVMPGGLYLSGSRIRAEFRFHPSDLHRITVIAGDILQMRNGMEIVSLGPDPGGMASIDAVNDRISLSMVGFDTDLPPEIASSGITDAYFEVDSAHTTKDSLRTIAICNSPIHDSWQPLPGGGLYLTSVTAPFINLVRNGANEAHIPRAGTIMKLAGGKLRALAFMPRSLLREYLDVLFSVSRDHPGLYFDLSYVGDYGKDIWNWV
ncbi:MAG: hypothetical protein QXU18_00270 [Thermoplasmatales archaeon]